MKAKTPFAVLILIFACLPAYASYTIEGTTLEGEVTNGINIGDVDGDANSSFIDQGENYLSEANLRVTRESLGLIHKRFEDWRFESEINVRKTDDFSIDRRRDLHLLSLQARVYNPYVDITFGDFYSYFSDLTLSRNLEGFQGIFTLPKTNTKITTILSRAFLGEETFQNTRYVIGDRIEQQIPVEKIKLIEQIRPFDRSLIRNVTAGVNLVHNFDSSGSIERDTNVPDIRNLVLSTDLAAQFFDDVNSKIEIARSLRDDSDDVTVGGDVWGTAIKLVNDYAFSNRFGDTQMNFDYERTNPGFFTESGSAVLDREAFYGRLYHKFGRPVDVEGNFREFHDNLGDDFTTSLRIRNPVFRVTLQPISEKNEQWKDLAFRLSYDLQDAESTDGTIHNQTHIFAGTASHRIKDVSLSFGYDVRRIIDTASTSDRTTQSFNPRISYDFSWEFIQAYPYVDYIYRVQQDYTPREKEQSGDYRMGLAVTLFEKLRVNTNYGYNDVNRQLIGQDTELHFWDVSVEFDLTEHFMLVGSYRMLDDNFEVHNFDFEEDYAEFKLVWRV